MKTIMKILITLIVSTLMMGTASAQIVEYNHIQFTLPDNLTVTGNHTLEFFDNNRTVINYGDEWTVSYSTDNREAEGTYLYNYNYPGSDVWYNVWRINYGQSVIDNGAGNAISVFHPEGAFIH
jgi:hypothetical protein